MFVSRYYAAGAWQHSAASETLPVRDPASDLPIGAISVGHVADVDAAVAAARSARDAWAAVPVADRTAALLRVRAGLEARAEEAAQLITSEMGAPLWLSRAAQVGAPVATLGHTAATMDGLPLETICGGAKVIKVPVGVVGAITPWNFPLMQIVGKVAPALAAGCTIVLKPSELTPFDAVLLTEVIHEAGLPPGVFNLVLGRGDIAGEALVRHPDVDMVSFTGSTRGGRRVATVAAETLKKVTLELGGKSANILMPGTDLGQALPLALRQSMLNSGQVCASLSRLFVPKPLLPQVEEILLSLLPQWTVGDPRQEGIMLGPVASITQRDHIRTLIDSGTAQGAHLLAGGTEAPAGLDRGAYVRPTIFTKVDNRMRIAQEEIFGPVLSVIGYRDEDHAVAMANDSIYGLAGGVWAPDIADAERVARRLHTGMVALNGRPGSPDAPFGGVKQSGYGREGGRYGIEEYLMTKSLNGAT